MFKFAVSCGSAANWTKGSRISPSILTTIDMGKKMLYVEHPY